MVYRVVIKQPFDLLRDACGPSRAFPLLECSTYLEGCYIKTVCQFEAIRFNIAPTLTLRLPKSRHFDAFSLDFDTLGVAGGLPRAFLLHECSRHFQNCHEKAVYQDEVVSFDIPSALTLRLPRSRRFNAFF